jgi:uncharacterized protein involved in outer membrane biogenesis
MRKWAIAGIVSLSFCTIIVLGLLNLNSLINRNRDYLLNRARQALGREVTVGEMAVTLWNGIGVRLDKFVLSDDPSFSSSDFVRAKDLQVNVRLLPLLRKELQVKRLILHNPVIEVIRNEEGEFNFSSIGKHGKEREKEREKVPTKEGQEPDQEKAAPPLLVSLLDISGGEVHYLDRKDGIDLRVKAIDFRVEDLDFDEPFSVDLAGALFSEKQNLKAQTRVGPLGPQGDLSETALEGKINIDPMDFGKLESALPAVKAALPKDLDLSGILRVKDVQLKGTLKKFALKGILEGTDAAISFGKSFQKTPGVPFVFSVEAQYADNTVSFRQAKVKLNTLEVAGKGEMRLGDVAVVNLSLDSNQVSLQGWEKMIPAIQSYQLSGKLEMHTTLQGKVGKGATPQIQGTLTLSGVSAKPPQFPKAVKDLNTRINFTGQRADFKETTLSLGNSRIRLAAEITRFSPLALSYKLSTREIWPADFQASLPDERKADVIQNLSSEGALGAKHGALTFQGKLASAQGTLYKINYKDLATSLVWENNVASIRSLRVNALSGSLQAEGEYAFNNPVPRFSLASRVQGLDLGQLYRSLDPKGPRDIQGRINADMKVSGSGKKWEEIKPNLRGQGQAEVLQGALINFNIAEGVLSGITGVPGLSSLINPQVRKKYPETFEAKDTEFKELKGLFTLADARMNVRDLTITAADYTVQGNGWVGFDRRVDFQSLLVFSPRLSADLAHSVREVSYMFNSQNQFEIPFTLTGTLPKVKPKPDSSYLAKMIQRGMVRKGAEELQRRFFGTKPSTPPAESAPSDRRREKKRSPAEELIRKGLEGLFGR